MLASVGLVLVGSIALHVQSASNVAPQQVEQIVRLFAHSVEQQSGEQVSRSDAIESCRPGEACVGELIGRLQSDRLVLITLTGGITRVRFLAELVDRDGLISSASGSAPASSPQWPPLMENAARTLFFAPAPVTKSSAPGAAETRPELVLESEPESAPVLPWILVATGGALAIAGGIFAVSATGARDDLQQHPYLDAAYAERSDHLKAHQMTAGVLLGAAVISMGTGVFLAALD